MRSATRLLAAFLAIAPAAALAQEPPGPAELPAPPLDTVLLEKARAYLDDYERRFGGVIAVENYEQTETVRLEVTRRRELVSDLLIARVPGHAWVAYRDVAEVDGKPVRDRQARLERLLREAPKGGDAVARRYREESARYNIGEIKRNINVPTVALVLLERKNADQVAVSRLGDAVVEGRLAAVLHVTERRPGVLARSDRGEPAESEASFWIDAGTGAVLRSELTVRATLVRAQVAVGYRNVPDVGMLLPFEMREVYEQLGQQYAHSVEGVATYEKYLHPDVSMQEWLKPGQ
jgi:hypothetical protein